MASYVRERNWVEILLRRLGLDSFDMSDPNNGNPETGIDVIVELQRKHLIGVQVTEIDPHKKKGEARKREKNISENNIDRPYMFWAQNNQDEIYDSLNFIIDKKVKNLANHKIENINELWLLVCSGIPELGAFGATVVMHQWLTEQKLNEKSSHILENSKFDQCYFLSVMQTSLFIFQWSKQKGWIRLNLTEL